MALTFTTAGLIQILDGILDAKLADEQRYAAECEQARAAYKRKWWGNRRPETRQLRDYLTKCLRNDEPPESEIVRTFRGRSDSNDSWWFTEAGDASVSKPAFGYYRADELKGLRELLKAHTGDTVTAHQLKELGTHSRDLEKLFRAAVTAGASSFKATS